MIGQWAEFDQLFAVTMVKSLRHGILITETVVKRDSYDSKVFSRRTVCSELLIWIDSWKLEVHWSLKLPWAVRFWFLWQPWVEVLHVQRSATRHSSDSWNRFWNISCLKNRTANVLRDRSTLPCRPVRRRTIVSQHLSLPAIELLATLTPFPEVLKRHLHFQSPVLKGRLNQWSELFFW